MRELPPHVVEHARASYGVVTSEELEQAGLDRTAAFRATRAGLLTRVAPRTYAVPSLAGPLTTAAALAAHYPEVVCAGRTAAALWDLDGFRGLPPNARPPLDLAWTGPRRCRSVPAQRARLEPADIVERAGVRVTSITRTLLDLGETPSVALDTVELALESALRSGFTTEAELRLVAEASGPRGAGVRAALGRRRPGAAPTESYAETRFLQSVVRPVGLDDPERQVEVFVEGRPAPYRVDFLFRRRLGALAVEIDGSAWHGPASARDDHMRDHHLRMAGVHTLRLSAERVDRRPAAARTALRRELSLLDSTEP